MLVVPAYAFTPLKFNIPAPDFVKFLPLITPLTPALLPSTTVLVVVIVMSPPNDVPLFDVAVIAEAILIFLALILIAPLLPLIDGDIFAYPLAFIVPAIVEFIVPFKALKVILPLK